ncbi:MAG: shikimate dehydrogenase [Actinomycetota bacterium]|nr:shikimate dehydrogenase [Actinomycetota bacterium]
MSSRINGRTRLAGVIGWPLDHTLSPAMHNAVYEVLGLDWAYIPLSVRDENDLMRVLGAVRALPFVGFNITMPFKQAMLSLCDEVAMLAKMAGAVNSVHVVDGRFIGYNTDGRGLLESLESDAGFQPEGRDVVILGAGGAAGAAFLSLMLGKAKTITVLNRNVERAEELVDRMSGHMRNTEARTGALGPGAEETVRSADLVVNATPMGMNTDDPSPLPIEWLGTGQVVMDMVYGRGSTALLDGARSRGATTLDGLGMLVAQGAIAVDIWSDSAQTRTPRDVMRSAAEKVLAERLAESGDIA